MPDAHRDAPTFSASGANATEGAASIAWARNAKTDGATMPSYFVRYYVETCGAPAFAH